MKIKGRKDKLIQRAQHLVPCLRKACYMGRSPQQCMILLTLYIKDGATIDDLFLAMGVDDSSIYARIRYLCDTGDIAILRDGGNRTYTLTPRGRELVSSMLCARNTIPHNDD